MRWQDCRERWERVRWARFNAGYQRATDAAKSLNIKPVTYRTYEHGPDENGREPSLSEIQRIARKFKVNWIWLAAGEDTPLGRFEPDQRIIEIDKTVSTLPDDRKDDALNAALGAVRAFRRA